MPACIPVGQTKQSLFNILYMANKKTEEFKVDGKELVTKVKELIKQGNARKITIKNSSGKTLVSIPLTWGAIGAVIAPLLASVATVAALVTSCTIVVERDDV